MARPKLSVPTYKLHAASGQAVCYINRQRVYLGRYNSPESKAKFAEIVAGRMAPAATDPASPSNSPRGATVSELLLRFATDELPRYTKPERRCFTGVIRLVRQFFGESPAAEFGPVKLRIVRDKMTEGDKAVQRKPWSRSFTNKQIQRLRQIFKFGVSWEIVPQTVADSLASVRALSAGESTARETSPRVAVSDADLNAVRQVLTGVYRDIFDLLLLTGGRPGEIVLLKTGDIDRSGAVWKAELQKHKTAHKGKRRVLFFNAAAQAILLRHLKADPDARLFRTKRDTFGEHVAAACRTAGVKKFVPHQLRHTVATKLVDECGVESAQRLLGHSQAAMTAHYSRMADRIATEAVQKLG